jgi:hypothetical protein
MGVSMVVAYCVSVIISAVGWGLVTYIERLAYPERYSFKLETVGDLNELIGNVFNSILLVFCIFLPIVNVIVMCVGIHSIITDKKISKYQLSELFK